MMNKKCFFQSENGEHNPHDNTDDCQEVVHTENREDGDIDNELREFVKEMDIALSDAADLLGIEYMDDEMCFGQLIDEALCSESKGENNHDPSFELRVSTLLF